MTLTRNAHLDDELIATMWWKTALCVERQFVDLQKKDASVIIHHSIVNTTD